MYLTAVGGVIVKPGLARMRFQALAIPSFVQAGNAEGCVKHDTWGSGALHMSISVWESSDAMSAYARSGVHARAARKIDALSEDWEFYHFTSDTVPSTGFAVDQWWSKSGLGQRLRADGRGAA